MNDSQNIFNAYVTEATTIGAPAQPAPQSAPQPQAAPQPPQQPAQPAAITGQHILNFFQQKKNITSQQSRTLMELTNSPQTVIANPRVVIQTVLQETQYNQIIPDAQLSAKFLSAIKDYEEALTRKSPIQVGETPPPEQTAAPVDMAELKKMFDRKVKQVVAEFKKKHPETPSVVVNTFVNTLANASAQALNQTASTTQPPPSSVTPETKPVKRKRTRKA